MSNYDDVELYSDLDIPIYASRLDNLADFTTIKKYTLNHDLT